MPPTQHGQPYRLGPNRWGLRYYDADGVRRRKSPFPSKSAALAHYREVIEPVLRGELAPLVELTLAQLVELGGAVADRARGRRAPQALPRQDPATDGRRRAPSRSARASATAARDVERWVAGLPAAFGEKDTIPATPEAIDGFAARLSADCEATP
jgi:hypothetical protein